MVFEYTDFLNAPCKVINLEKNTSRWKICKERIQDVAQEFIPSWPDKLAALRKGVEICDV